METIIFTTTSLLHLTTPSQNPNHALPRKPFSPPPLRTTSSFHPLILSPRQHRFSAPLTSSNTSDPIPSPDPDFALLLEAQVILADHDTAHHRQAFNAAFQKLRLDCANWTQPIYTDLFKRTGGDEEKMVRLYFNKTGWPTSLPTTEIPAFVKSVLQEKKTAASNTTVINEDAVIMASALRPGVEEFIDEAFGEGIPVVILTTYGEEVGEKSGEVVKSVIGSERVGKVTIIDQEVIERSMYSQLVSSSDNMLLTSDSISEQMASEALKAVNAEKLRVANEVAEMLRVSVEIDTGSSGEGLKRVVAALRAGAEVCGVGVEKCVLVAGSLSGLAGARSVGMPCVVVRSSLTVRAEFPEAKAVYDGFGGGDLTVGKLRKKKL